MNLWEIIINYWLEFILTIISGACIAVIKSQHKKVKALMVGTQALLRAELIRSGEKYIERGFVPIYAKDAFDKAYISYHNLGRSKWKYCGRADARRNRQSGEL